LLCEAFRTSLTYFCYNAARTQGISAVENIMGRAHVINHEHIPAACFTHPEIAMVGLTEEQAKARAAEQGFPLGKSVGHFRANSKALAELEADGIAKVRIFMLSVVEAHGQPSVLPLRS
jgi:pyruvate/2-oxoglutarate dehydrogenase complex dihydrolipoamide dehydrogenase (E3) component